MPQAYLSWLPSWCTGHSVCQGTASHRNSISNDMPLPPAALWANCKQNPASPSPFFPSSSIALHIEVLCLPLTIPSSPTSPRNNPSGLCHPTTCPLRTPESHPACSLNVSPVCKPCMAGRFWVYSPYLSVRGGWRDRLREDRLS